MGIEEAASIVADHYALQGLTLTRVDGGADPRARLWKAVDAHGRRFAVKWSSSGSPAGLVVPAVFNAARPCSAPIPIPTRDGALWADVEGARLSVMEWIGGTRALDTHLGRGEWQAFGQLMAALHALPVEGRVRAWVPREEFDPSRWVELFQRVDAELDTAPARWSLRRVSELWASHRAALWKVHRRTLELASRLRTREDLPRFVLCHADPHLGNVVANDGHPVLIDFDDAVLAPRERDLMFVLGGGVLTDRAITNEQQEWFLDGYGPHQVDTDLLTYYRSVRVMEDASELAGIVLDPASTDEGRREALHHIEGIFSPTGLLAQARSTGAPPRR